jgi:methylenetetrahydrofolate reductase (NADH)
MFVKFNLPDAEKPSGSAPVRLHRLFAPFSIEVVATSAIDVNALRDQLPSGSRVFIPHLLRSTNDLTIDLADRMKRTGLHPVPHIAARLTTDADHLSALLRGLADIGTIELLVIAGGVRNAIGQFRTSHELLDTGLFQRYGFNRLLFAGHPDGHPMVKLDIIERALLEKIRYAREHGLRAGVITQFCFNRRAIFSWLERMNEQGLDAPVYIGMPGPASMKTLLRYASVCGVTTSIGMVRKRPQETLYGLMRNSSRDDFFVDLAERMGRDAGRRVAGVHLFPFGGIEQSVQWAEAMTKRVRQPGNQAVVQKSGYGNDTKDNRARRRRVSLALLTNRYRLTVDREMQFRSIGIALVVGTILNGINQGDELVNGGDINLFKACLTFVVPYWVAIYSAVAGRRKKPEQDTE